MEIRQNTLHNLWVKEEIRWKIRKLFEWNDKEHITYKNGLKVKQFREKYLAVYAYIKKA